MIRDVPVQTDFNNHSLLPIPVQSGLNLWFAHSAIDARDDAKMIKRNVTTFLLILSLSHPARLDFVATRKRVQIEYGSAPGCAYA